MSFFSGAASMLLASDYASSHCYSTNKCCAQAEITVHSIVHSTSPPPDLRQRPRHCVCNPPPRKHAGFTRKSSGRPEREVKTFVLAFWLPPQSTTLVTGPPVPSGKYCLDRSRRMLWVLAGVLMIFNFIKLRLMDLQCYSHFSGI